MGNRSELVGVGATRPGRAFSQGFLSSQRGVGERVAGSTGLSSAMTTAGIWEVLAVGGAGRMDRQKTTVSEA